MQAERYIATADLGTSKVALTVARIEGDDVQVIYYKERPSNSMRYGSILNPSLAAAPLRAALDEAEQELGMKIRQLFVGLPRCEVRQEIASSRIPRSEPDSCITREEIQNLKQMAIDSYQIQDDKEEIFGAVAQSFSADDELIGASENEIVGMSADNIEANFKVFVGRKRPVSNLDKALNIAGVAVADKMFLPTCVAKAVLTEDEKENGVALVEIGAGVTSLTIYKGKILRHYSSIPFGGKSVTADIKYECSFNDSLAENVKLAYGACMPDKLQSLSEKVLQINDDESYTHEQLPVKYLSEIIDARMKEIVEAILWQIEDSGYADKLRSGVVITGGGANLTNVNILIREMSGYNVRMGYPRTQTISVGGCNGIREAGAAASLGMLLDARRNPYINCMEDVPIEEQLSEEITVEETAAPIEETSEPIVETETPIEEPKPTEKEKTATTVEPNGNEKEKGGFWGGLFNWGSDDVIRPTKHKEKKVRQPKPEPKPRQESLVWKKITNGLDTVFDNTVGNLFDDMEKDNDN